MNEILKGLFEAINKNDLDLIIKSLKQIIAEQKGSNNQVLVSELSPILKSIVKKKKLLDESEKKQTNNEIKGSNIPFDEKSNLPLLEIQMHNYDWDQVVLSSKITDKINMILQEYDKKSLLNAYYLSPASKFLFYGPPGCGKTLTAQTLSSQMRRPMLYIRFVALISSYLGETAVNLEKIFKFAKSGKWVIFFDEFDAIGKSRRDLQEVGEIKRMINVFLQLLDNFQGDSIIICATNFLEQADSAMLRRFDEIILFDLPDTEERKKLFKLFLNNAPQKKINYDLMAEKTKGLSGSDIQQISQRLFKKALITTETIKDEWINEEISDQIYKNNLRNNLLYDSGKNDSTKRKA